MGCGSSKAVQIKEVTQAVCTPELNAGHETTDGSTPERADMVVPLLLDETTCVAICGKSTNELENECGSEDYDRRSEKSKRDALLESVSSDAALETSLSTISRSSSFISWTKEDVHSIATSPLIRSLQRKLKFIPPRDSGSKSAFSRITVAKSWRNS